MAEFRVLADEMRSVAAGVQYSGSRVAGLRSALLVQLAAEGPAWGTGDLGQTFASGPNGYLAQKESTEEFAHSLVNELEHLANNLREAANIFQASDTGQLPGG